MAAPAPAAADALPEEEFVAPSKECLVGHWGNLDDKQQKLYDDLNASELALHHQTLDYLAVLDRARILKKEGREATVEELSDLRVDREAEWPFELCRFLRAQKWDLDKTRKCYQEYLAWRRANNVDSIIDELPYNVNLIKRVVGHSALSKDRQGRPIYIEKSGGVHVDAILSCFTDEDILYSHLWQQENSVRRAALESKLTGKHVELFTQILDLRGLSSASQRALKYTKAIFTTDAAYYPERLGDLYVVNAPWIFPVIWAIVKGWIDPVTRSKIHVIKGDPSKTLLAAIAPEELPKEYGGTADECKEYTLDEFLAAIPLKEADVQLATELVKHGKRFNQKLEGDAGEVIEWFWKQADKDDIDWSVIFTPRAHPDKPVTVSAECRIVGAGGVPAVGSYELKEAGTLTLEWSNYFSWMANKEIKYCVRKTDKRRQAEP